MCWIFLILKRLRSRTPCFEYIKYCKKWSVNHRVQYCLAHQCFLFCLDFRLLTKKQVVVRQVLVIWLESKLTTPRSVLRSLVPSWVWRFINAKTILRKHNTKPSSNQSESGFESTQGQICKCKMCSELRLWEGNVREFLSNFWLLQSDVFKVL